MHEVVNKMITETQKISFSKALNHKAHLYICSLLCALITGFRIVLRHKKGFSSVTVQLARYGLVWQVWMQSLEVVICSFGLCEIVRNRLGAYVPLSHTFMKNLISHLPLTVQLILHQFDTHLNCLWSSVYELLQLLLDSSSWWPPTSCITLEGHHIPFSFF